MFFYTLSFARAFFLPVVLAWLMSFMLRPLIRALEKLSVPKALGATLIMVTLIALLSIGVVRLYAPAVKWMEDAPNGLDKVESKVRAFLKPAEHVSQAVEQVQKMTNIENTGDSKKVEVKEQSLLTSIFTWTKSFLLGVLMTFVLLFFLLSRGDMFMRKLIKIMDRPEDKQAVVDIARQTEETISGYLFTIAIVNTGVGIVVALAMYLVGLPNPALWGALAGLLNFIPYLGPTCCFAVISFISLLHFDTPGSIILPPLTYLGLHALENYAITPLIVGNKLALNPVVIFIAVIFWGWLWGVPGAMIAVPLLVAFKIFCDQIPALATVSELISP